MKLQQKYYIQEKLLCQGKTSRIKLKNKKTYSKTTNIALLADFDRLCRTIFIDKIGKTR